MKRWIVALLILALATATPACVSSAPAPAATASPSPNPVPSAPDEGYVDGIIIPYVTIAPVRAETADELRIAFPEGMEQPIVVAMADGGALALGQKVEYGALEIIKSSKIIAARYDRDGNALWTKTYDELPDGNAVQARALGGSGFAFTMSEIAGAESGQGVQNRQDIVVCGAEGHIAYRESSVRMGLYQHILECDAGICVVGDGGYRNGKLVGEALTEGYENALTILAQGPISSVFFSRTAKADGYFSPMATVWTKESGLVAAAYKDDTGDGRTSGIIAYDMATLEEKWRYGGDALARTIFEGLYPAAGGVLENGYTGGNTFIMKLGPDGKKLWQIDPDGSGEYAVIAMNAYPNGAFAAAINRYKEGDSMRGVYLALYDEAGGMKKKIALKGETIRDLQPLDGGGLVTVGTQNIKVLPAPAYLSSIWYDTETVITRYDENLSILWRKVYDRYHDVKTPDVAVPTAEGRVIVEG